MPYISQVERQLAADRTLIPRKEGQLNYLITELVKQYVDLNGLNYATINSVVGALDCAKMEFYRRVAVPYEDKKIAENGDVY